VRSNYRFLASVSAGQDHYGPMRIMWHESDNGRSLATVDLPELVGAAYVMAKLARYIRKIWGGLHVSLRNRHARGRL